MVSTAKKGWILALAAMVLILMGVGGSGCGLILGIHDISEGGSGGEGSGGSACNNDLQCDDKDLCTTDSCSAGVCGHKSLADGPAPDAVQTPFDCKVVTCAAGKAASQDDDKDIPDDKDDCTVDTCAQGQSVHTAKLDTTACTEAGANGLCMGGVCVVICTHDMECDDQNPCTDDSCDAGNGTCSHTPLNGVPTPGVNQVAGDCKQRTCVDGVDTNGADDSDLPVTATDCDYELCDNGTPSNPPHMKDSACNTSGGKYCDGAGACVQCNDPAECGINDDCKTFACSAMGVCSVANQPQGTHVSAGMGQVLGDCKAIVCDGQGNVAPGTIVDDMDVPVDQNDCTANDCTNGAPSNPAEPVGFPCGVGMMQACSVGGQCGCANDAQCIPPQTCGGGNPGSPFVCGCTQKTCQQLGITCGPMAADACNGAQNCDDSTQDGAETDVDCGGGGGCATKCANTKKCNADSDCANGHCADGVCCNTACTGTCLACNIPGSIGTCSNVPTNTPDNNPVNACVGTVECDGSGGCKKINGQVCAASSECLSGQCVDGVCCNTACAGNCQACTAAKNGGADGTCGNILTGQPDNNPVCNGANLCDGNGNCKKVDGQACTLNAQCLSAECIDGVCCNTVCNGTCQSCVMAKTGLADGSCNNIVSGQTDNSPACNGGNVCDGMGSCKKSNGQGCASGAQCLSNSCVDGVCCNNACSGTCTSCNQAGNIGTCTNIPANGTDASPVCSGTSLCDGAGNCKKVNGQSCTMTSQCLSGQCADGVCCTTACMGNCQSCLGVKTGGSDGTCANIQSGQTDNSPSCSGTQACDGSGNCKSINGQTCSLPTECVSGNCVDGYCCNGACGTACFACNVGGSLGTCTFVANGQPDNNPANACTGGNVCDGAGNCKSPLGAACVGGGTCTSGSCADGVCCNNSCAATCYACNVAGMMGTCSPSANGQGDANGSPACGGGNLCDGMGNCKQPLGTGCSSGSQCTSGSCADSVCCNSGCGAACFACNLAGNMGTCTAIALNGTDNNPAAACTGGNVCDGNGTCKVANGQACAGGGAGCASNVCSDGVCCDTACTGPCVSCVINNGTCTPIAKGSNDPPVCNGSMACDGAGACKLGTGQGCTMNSECASGTCAALFCL
jgi:hypothetical protein